MSSADTGTSISKIVWNAAVVTWRRMIGACPAVSICRHSYYRLTSSTGAVELSIHITAGCFVTITLKRLNVQNVHCLECCDGDEGRWQICELAMCTIRRVFMTLGLGGIGIIRICYHSIIGNPSRYS